MVYQFVINIWWAKFFDPFSKSNQHVMNHIMLGRYQRLVNLLEYWYFMISWIFFNPFSKAIKSTCGCHIWNEPHYVVSVARWVNLVGFFILFFFIGKEKITINSTRSAQKNIYKILVPFPPTKHPLLDYMMPETHHMN